MEIYGQETEVHVIGRLLGQAESQTMVDVGAEQGAFTEAMLSAGAEHVFAFDPHPGNVAALESSFAGDARVSVGEYAISDEDGTAELHVSTAPNGTPISFGHTLLERPGTDEITWTDTLVVARRSLASLVADGEIPPRVGVLKIDTEGHDLAVVLGSGELHADVVMVEHWSDLPHGLGPCPWSTEEMLAALRARGYSHFALVVHHGEFSALKWDQGNIEPGLMGNLIFIHDSRLDSMRAELLGCAAMLSERAVEIGLSYAEVAAERATLAAELGRAADERLALVQGLKQAADERLALVDRLTQSADERLAQIRELTSLAESRLQALENARDQLEHLRANSA